MLRIMMIFLLVTESYQSVLRIEQEGEGIVNEETDLRCIQEGDAVGATDGYMEWRLRAPPGDEYGHVDMLAYVQLHNGTVIVNSKYEYKVNASYEPDVFTLTIKNLSLSDDEKLADWLCYIETMPDINFTAPHRITVKVPPTAESINLNGLPADWVIAEQPYTLACTVASIYPDASVYWSIDGETQLETLTNSSENWDGTFLVTGTLSDYPFNKTRGRVPVSCLVTEKDQPASVIFTQHYKDVDVYWNATTRVTNYTTYPPIEGRRYELLCEVIDGNPSPTHFRWQGESSTQQILVIESLNRSLHTTNFSCLAVNAAGQGEFGEELHLQVWYPPSVSASGPGIAVAGSSVTLTCSSTDGFPEQITDVHWQKDGNYLHEGSFSFTLPNLTLSDAGDYTCIVTNGAGDGTSQPLTLDVLVPPTSDSTYLSGIMNDWVMAEQPYTLTCTVDPIKPDASVYWSIDGETQLETLTNRSENGDGTFRVTVTLSDYQFNKTRGRVSVSCLVTEKDQPASVIFTKHYKDVDVYWNATTRVTNYTTYPPIEGERYELLCEVIDGNPSPTNFRWQGESSTQQILVLESLNRSLHTTNFSCLAVNAAGDGEFGEELPLQVWYPPSVSASGPGIGVAGSSVTLTCSSTDAFPQQITYVQWKKIGNYLHGGYFTNTLRNLQKSDAGDYTCILTNGAGDGESQPLTLDILYSPEGSSLSVTPARSEIAVGEVVTFTCQHTGNSNPQPNAYTFYKDGEQQQNSSRKTWTLGTSSIHDGGAVSCEASNSIGAADRSQEKVITVQAPATIEAFPAYAQSPEYDADFSMACVGAGNERTVEWTKDGTDLPEEDFVDDGSGTVHGSYSFGQEEAYEKRYRWVAAAGDTCSTVKRHNGEYTCTVTATAGGTFTQNSATMHLSVRYPPINKESDFVEVHVGLREAVTLPCDVCANPEPHQYTWSRPDGAVLATSGSSLIISNVTEDDFGIYTCRVTTPIALRKFVIGLAAYGVPEQPSEFRVMPDTSGSVIVSWKPGFNGGLTQTFDLQGRKAGDTAYVNIKRNIPDPNTHPKDDQTVSLTVTEIGEVNQTPLQPDTTYEFVVRGENSHPGKYGPNAYAEGKTNAIPVVKLNADTLRYSHDTTHLFFEWRIEAGKPDKLELQYRESQSKSRRRRPRSTEWITMVTVDPDPGFYEGFYDDVTGVQLDPDRSYELRLVAYEGAEVSEPDEEQGKVVLDPAQSAGDSGGALPIGATVGISLGTLVVGALAGVAGTKMFMKRRSTPKKEAQSTEDDGRIYANVNPLQLHEVPADEPDPIYYNTGETDKGGLYEELSRRVTSLPPVYDTIGKPGTKPSQGKMEELMV